MEKNIIIENDVFALTIDSACQVKSLIYKPADTECLTAVEDTPLFSVTQARPFNNEVKLAYPTKRTTFYANCVRREGNKLIVGFEIAPYEAVVEIKERPEYITFTLADFIVHPTDYEGICITPPPVEEFRLMQLPVTNREHFGEWLNVSWDEDIAVNVLATSPEARIDALRRNGYRILSADAVKGIRLKGCEAALIVSRTDRLLDVIDAIEEDYDLPRGVKSRRSDKINSSMYWTMEIEPATVDEHIALAKKGGFTNMLIYWGAIFAKGKVTYKYCNEYDYCDNYPKGYEDLKAMLDKIKAAGITPGLHILHSHIGTATRYVTPVADSRLNLTRHFTLSRPLGTEDTTIYVDRNPEGVTLHPKCRVLRFGGELIRYESYSEEYPYRFEGCVRGHFDTTVTTHPAGEIGGVLDVSEFGATSIYLDQYTDLQDEVAEKIAAFYKAGFEFVYFDGSEGVNAPYEYHVANAQYRVYQKLNPTPLFCEGAAKSHFSWHMISGGNAFDVFQPCEFKEMLRVHPAAEIHRMQEDFTRVNFGWWDFFSDTQPDQFEYGTSRAAAWGCPITLRAEVERGREVMKGLFGGYPRMDDCLEVLRRWEDVRAKHWLTPERKKTLKDLNQEHILLINEEGEYELLPYAPIENVPEEIGAYHFERRGRQYAVCWHKSGESTLRLQLAAEEVVYEKELGGSIISFMVQENSVILPVSGRAYVSSNVSKEKFIQAFKKGK